MNSKRIHTTLPIFSCLLVIASLIFTGCNPVSTEQSSDNSSYDDNSNNSSTNTNTTTTQTTSSFAPFSLSIGTNLYTSGKVNWEITSSTQAYQNVMGACKYAYAKASGTKAVVGFEYTQTGYVGPGTSVSSIGVALKVITTYALTFTSKNRGTYTMSQYYWHYKDGSSTKYYSGTFELD